MHAIIETGGKQFRVAPGDVIRVPKLAGDPGAEVALGKVMAVVSGWRRTRERRSGLAEAQ